VAACTADEIACRAFVVGLKASIPHLLRESHGGHHESNAKPDNRRLLGRHRARPATSVDDKFLARLTKGGINVNNKQTALTAAKHACDSWNNMYQQTGGKIGSYLLEYIITQARVDTGLNADKAGYLVGAATGYYCPQYAQYVSNPGGSVN
jgi:hypothetical protein